VFGVNLPLAEILRYNRWATLQLVEACRVLNDEQLDTQGLGTSGTVRQLLLHVVGGQQTFALRLRGRQHEHELGRLSAWPGFDVLMNLARQSADELVEFAEHLDHDVSVDLPYQGRVFRFPASFFLTHAAEHGVEHRTEIKVALAQHGVETPDLDGWAYGAAAGYGEEVSST